MATSKTFYLNNGESSTLDLNVSSFNELGETVPVDFDTTEVQFYVKLREQDKDTEAFIKKSSLNFDEIVVTDPLTGECQILIVPEDTEMLEEQNVTKFYKYSVRLKTANTRVFLREGNLVVTPR